MDPVLRKPGSVATPSAGQLTSILDLGKPLGAVYRANLIPLAQTALIEGIGAPDNGARFIRVETARPGNESLVLLPEFWEQVEKALGRVALLALPDRTTCRFVPAGPWRMVVEMSKDFARQHAEASDPLAAHFLIREGNRLRAGPRFAAIAGL